MATVNNNVRIGENYALYLGDCCELIRQLPDDTIDYSIYSPPFSSLYVYSDSERDMGNCEDDAEFFEHYSYLVAEQFRVHRPGRLCSVHCMNLPTSKQSQGYIGIRDFRGSVIRCFETHGWIFHSEVVIWKDPVVAMQRTKALGLLHKQLVKDSCMSRQGIPDYVCTFRKPGNNTSPVAGRLDRFVGDESFKSTGDLSIDIWQRYASPVWSDINQSRTLNYRMARDEKDERHICPLQLDVIERCLQLWSNEGDTVLSPFAGIGSEGVMSLRLGRKFVGFELKQSYFDAACKFLEQEELDQSSARLF